MRGNILLDSFALLAFLNREENYQPVMEFLKLADKQELIVFINEINIGECYYIIYRERSIGDADNFLITLQTLPIELVTNSLDDIIEAARIKARYPISYADAFVVATAISKGTAICTGDPEFKRIEQLAQVIWI